MTQLTLAQRPVAGARRLTWVVSLRPAALRRVGALARREPAGACGFALVLLAVLVAVGAPWLAPYDPLETGLAVPLSGPTAGHLLGADALGRDVLSRLIWGARISLSVSLGAVTVATLLGVALGLLGGYVGGWPDLLIQRVVDVLLALPTLVLALALSATLGGSVLALTLIVAVTLVPLAARIVRADVLVAQQLQFVDAARSLGASEARVVRRHLLPAVLPSIVVLATIDLGVVMIVEASLSFLGVGVPAPAPSWGQMLTGAATQYFRQAPLLAILPGLAISIVVLGVNLAGDGLRNLLDPRFRRRG